jgi:hypothetical protein
MESSCMSTSRSRWLVITNEARKSAVALVSRIFLSIFDDRILDGVACGPKLSGD